MNGLLPIGHSNLAARMALKLQPMLRFYCLQTPRAELELGVIVRPLFAASSQSNARELNNEVEPTESTTFYVFIDDLI